MHGLIVQLEHRLINGQYGCHRAFPEHLQPGFEPLRSISVHYTPAALLGSGVRRQRRAGGGHAVVP